MLLTRLLVCQCFFITVTIFGGALYFQELAAFSKLQMAMFPVGVLVTIGGILLLSQRQHKHGAWLWVQLMTASACNNCTPHRRAIDSAASRCQRGVVHSACETQRVCGPACEGGVAVSLLHSCGQGLEWFRHYRAGNSGRSAAIDGHDAQHAQRRIHARSVASRGCCEHHARATANRCGPRRRLGVCGLFRVAGLGARLLEPPPPPQAWVCRSLAWRQQRGLTAVISACDLRIWVTP